MISGFRRLAAVRQLGWEYLPVRCLAEDLDDMRCIRYAIPD